MIGKIVARHAGDLLLYSALIIHFCIFCKPHLLCCMPVLAAGLRFYNTLLLVPTMFTLRATIDLNEISSRRKLCSIFYKIWPLRSLLTYSMYQEFNQLWGKESLANNKGLPYHHALAPCGEGGPPNAFPHQFPENPWVIIVNSADWLSTHAIFGQNWPSRRTFNFEGGKKGGPFLRQYTRIEMLSARIWHGRVSGVTIHNISNVIISSVFHGHCTITIK